MIPANPLDCWLPALPEESPALSPVLAPHYCQRRCITNAELALLLLGWALFSSFFFFFVYLISGRPSLVVFEKRSRRQPCQCASCRCPGFCRTILPRRCPCCTLCTALLVAARAFSCVQFLHVCLFHKPLCTVKAGAGPVPGLV